MRLLRHVKANRMIEAEKHTYGADIAGGDFGGVFSMVSTVDGKTLRIIASSGDGWDHVSISRPDRVPVWGEMEQVKRAFFQPDETAMQLHVATANHINIHPNCLHLWRPLDAAIPLPPAEFV